MLTIILTLGLLALSGLYFWYSRRNLPPGPWGLPILGYLPWISPTQPQLTLTALARKHGGIYSLQMGNIFTVVLSDVKLIRQALASDDFSGRAPLYLTHGLMKGNGIICAQGEKWKEARKFVANSLRSLGMVKFGEGRERMESDISNGVRELMAKLRDIGEDAIDNENILFHHMGNVVSQLVFGMKWKENDPTWKILQDLQFEGTKLMGVAGALNFLPFLRVLSKFNKPKKYLEEGIAFTYSIYQKILDEYTAQGLDDADNMMAQFMKEIGKRGGETPHFNNIQFKTLMADIFGAGVDTTLATLRWLLLYLAIHPDIQTRVQEELDFATQVDGQLKLQHFNECHYFEACICETQRIRPVTPLGMPHGAVKETSLGGYRIPAGSMIVPLQWAVHHDPEIYSNPDNFDPSRFLSEDGTFFKPEAFIPFQTGKRMCVGEEYARCLLFLFGGSILKEFRLSVPEGSVIDLAGETGITLNPPHHRIRFSKRGQL